jgi:hypothetical protein
MMRLNRKKNASPKKEEALAKPQHVKITKGKESKVDVVAESNARQQTTDEKVSEILAAEPEEPEDPEVEEADTLPPAPTPPPSPEFKGPDKEERRHKHSSDYDTYRECVQTLFAHMGPCMYDCFHRMRGKCSSSEEFSRALNSVVDWGPRQVTRRINEIKSQNNDETSHYFYYAYSANALVLANVISRNKEEVIELDLPDYATFVRYAYADSARRLRKVPGVFDTDIPDWQRIGVDEKIDTIFGNSIRTAIRRMIPMKKISPEMEKQMFSSGSTKVEEDQGVSDSENEGYSSEEEEVQTPRRRNRPAPVDEDDFEDEHDFYEEEDEDQMEEAPMDKPSSKTVHFTQSDLDYVDPPTNHHHH